MLANAPGSDLALLDNPSSHPTRVRNEVRAYYDNNTQTFEKYGQGATSIHRAVWAEGVTTRQQAFHHVDELVLAELRALGVSAPRVLDLGCGVGGTLMYLAAANAELTGVGVTLSPVQVQRANALFQVARAADRLRCVEADFAELPDERGEHDLAYAIESFVHCAEPERFFAAAASKLRAGGKLLVCDDFQERAPASPAEEGLLRSFREGWKGYGLTTFAAAEQTARAHGFRLRRDLNLTPFLELRRPRDIALSALLWAGKPFGFSGTLWRSWEGGDALQKGLLSGLLAYHFGVFERV